MMCAADSLCIFVIISLSALLLSHLIDFISLSLCTLDLVIHCEALYSFFNLCTVYLNKYFLITTLLEVCNISGAIKICVMHKDDTVGRDH